MHTLERTHPFTMERNRKSGYHDEWGPYVSRYWFSDVDGCVPLGELQCLGMLQPCQDQGQDHSLLLSRVVGGGQGNSTLTNLEDKQVIPTEGQCLRPPQKGHLSSSYSTNRPDHKDWKEVEFIPPLTQILRLHRCPA